MMQRQRRKVVDRVHLAVRQHLTIIGVDCGLDVVLEIAQVGMRRGQRIARGRIEHRRPGRRALAPAQEHVGIFCPPGDQRRDTKVVDALLA